MSTPRDTLRLAIDHDEDAASLAPETAASPADGRDEYAALADLFLSEPKPASAPALTPAGPHVQSPQSDEIEALIVGHLPVMGSAWVRQHARQTASDTGRAVALLRISAGHAALDVFGDTSAIENMVPAADLDAGIRTANHLRPHWMVRTDAVAETSMANAPGIGRRTLLTGADEAAIVAAYRAIKSLMPANVDEGVDARTGVVIMGAEPADAKAAGARIGRASEAFLGRSIDVCIGSEQIHTGPATTIFRGETDLDLASAIDLAASRVGLLKIGKPDRPSRPEPPEGGGRPKPRPGHRTPAAPTPRSVSAPAPVPAPPPPAPPKPSSSSPVPPQREQSMLPGMRIIAADCPAARGVELAIDSKRAPHLVARSHDRMTAERAAASLRAALSWFRAHESLLVSLTGQRFTAPVTQHLVVSNSPEDVRHLLDADIVVHLRVPPAASETLVTLSDPTRKSDAS